MRVIDWLDARSGVRRALRRLLDEPLPPGTGWWFTLGSVLLFLLVVQVLTGATLMLYYAPTPDHAHESVRFITERVPLGRFVRGLHYFGASFLVVGLGAHLLRVVVFGSFKAPRELTWLTGVALLLVVLAFALTGYLLPWDQRAYWATIVTINIAATTPVVGEIAATVLRGGPEVGALTLTRWYAAHVVWLPAALVVLVACHLYLMRRHGISGPIRPRAGAPQPFHPYQLARDLAVVAAVAVLLALVAVRATPPLERAADPTDARYVPRPEWYFLALFQLLKYFPGRLEPIASLVIPGLALAVLALLPWLDRSPHRDPRRRPIVLVGAALAVGALATLTGLGWRDRPANDRPAAAGWSLRAIAGRAWVAASGCARCHGEAGVADDLAALPATRDDEWLAGHVPDPEVIAPGVREAPAANERETAAIVAYVRRLRDGPLPPPPPPDVEAAAIVFARFCIGCHTIDGDGGTDGPDLSRIGREHDREWLVRWIRDPAAVKPDAEMPAFGRRLRAEQLEAIAAYLASRR